MRFSVLHSTDKIERILQIHMALILDLSLLIALLMYCTALPLQGDTKQRDEDEFRLQPIIIVVKPQPPSTEVEREPYYSPYPLTERFNSTAPQLIRKYDRSPHVAVSLLDTLDGYNEERACAEVRRFIISNLTHDTDECNPTYKCDFDPARYPSTLIKATCPRHSSCIDATYYRGTCWPKYSYSVTVLEFIPREESRLEEGSGSAPVKIEGEWFYKTLILVNSCFCSDGK